MEARPQPLQAREATPCGDSHREHERHQPKQVSPGRTQLWTYAAAVPRNAWHRQRNARAMPRCQINMLQWPAGLNCQACRQRKLPRRTALQSDSFVILGMESAGDAMYQEQPQAWWCRVVR